MNNNCTACQNGTVISYEKRKFSTAVQLVGYLLTIPCLIIMLSCGGCMIRGVSQVEKAKESVANIDTDSAVVIGQGSTILGLLGFIIFAVISLLGSRLILSKKKAQKCNSCHVEYS